jgi:transposase-like protein
MRGSTQCIADDRTNFAMYRLDRRRISYEYILDRAVQRGLAFVLEVSHTTVLRWLNNTGRNRDMRPAQ